MTLSKAASYEQFCDHYDLVPGAEESKTDYTNYLDMLEFTQQLMEAAQKRGEL